MSYLFFKTLDHSGKFLITNSYIFFSILGSLFISAHSSKTSVKLLKYYALKVHRFHSGWKPFIPQVWIAHCCLVHSHGGLNIDWLFPSSHSRCSMPQIRFPTYALPSTFASTLDIPPRVSLRSSLWSFVLTRSHSVMVVWIYEYVCDPSLPLLWWFLHHSHHKFVVSGLSLVSLSPPGVLHIDILLTTLYVHSTHGQYGSSTERISPYLSILPEFGRGWKSLPCKGIAMLTDCY